MEQLNDQTSFRVAGFFLLSSWAFEQLVATFKRFLVESWATIGQKPADGQASR
jgi:hypothetical protein